MNPETDAVTPFQILSLDGGGLKGLFAAAVLAELEADLQTRILDHFDLVAGTSTGGLVALALGAGYRPQEIVDFYVARGSHVFSRPRHVGRLVRPKHNAHRLRDALEDLLGPRRLGDSLTIGSPTRQVGDIEPGGLKAGSSPPLILEA